MRLDIVRYIRTPVAPKEHHVEGTVPDLSIVSQPREAAVVNPMSSGRHQSWFRSRQDRELGLLVTWTFLATRRHQSRHIISLRERKFLFNVRVPSFRQWYYDPSVSTLLISCVYICAVSNLSCAVKCDNEKTQSKRRNRDA